MLKLYNTSRGPIIHEADLIAALKKGKVSGWRTVPPEIARPEYAERHAKETPFRIALARVKPKDKDSGDVERFRLRQVTNRDGRAVALDRLTLRLQTLPRREGYWLDTGMLKTG